MDDAIEMAGRLEGFEDSLFWNGMSNYLELPSEDIFNALAPTRICDETADY